MARIAGVDIPREKRVEISLCYIYGIGLTTSRKILERTRVNPDTRVKDLTEEEGNRLREVIDRGYEYQAADQNRLQSWHAPPPQLAGTRSAHAHQRAYTSWSQENSGW